MPLISIPLHDGCRVSGSDCDAIGKLGSQGLSSGMRGDDPTINDKLWNEIGRLLQPLLDEGGSRRIPDAAHAG